jgi:replicative DNA helicase
METFGGRLVRPFEAEQLLISNVIRFGNSAARVCLPQLTPEKLVFSSDGSFGIGHSSIWNGVRKAYLTDDLSPTLQVLESYLNEKELNYLRTLPTQHNFEAEFVDQLANRVDKQGLVYNVSKYGTALGNNISSTEHFMQTLDTIQDVEKWSTEQLNKLRSNVSMQSEGYEHVSNVADRLRTEWDDVYNGRVSPIIESGIPSLKQHALFPKGEIAVIHGLSGSGKSTFVFWIQLGTAIDLYLNNKAGCVAVNSLEMTAERLVERMAGMLAQVNLLALKTQQITPEDYGKLHHWLEFVEQLPIFIDDTSFLTTTALQYRASGLHVSEFGPVVQLSSDYGELFQEEDSRMSKEQRIDKVFREQFHLSRYIGASIIAISQSTANAATSGMTHVAGADGTRYSRGILQSADVLAEMWNPVQIEKAGRLIVLGDNSTLTKAHPYLLLQKYRGGEVGVEIPFGWIPETTTFFDKSISQNIGNPTLFTHLDSAYNKYTGANQSW